MDTKDLFLRTSPGRAPQPLHQPDRIDVEGVPPLFVDPVRHAVELFRHANQPTELHLFADTDHFMFAEGNTRVHRVVENWLAKYFAVEAQAKAA